MSRLGADLSTDEAADDHHESPVAPARTSGWGIAIVVALIALAVFVQHPGEMVHDTRLDMAIDPWTFIARTWHLWQPSADMGQIQNQAAGYLFPMGPFFGVAHTLHIPVWITQRAWMSMLLGLAVWGMARVADEIEIGTPSSRLVAALGYALCPIFVSRIGAESSAVLGAAMLPWVLVPLIRATKGGSVRRAACWSGLAVFAMGGINGTVVAAVLVVPLLYLLTRARGPRRGALIRWWLMAVVLATSWWAIPLLFQGRYGIDFLALTEQSNTTTAYGSPIEAIRGTADWLSYFHLRGLALPAGYTLAYDGLAILGTALVAAAGLFGLARRDLPERRFLLVTFLVGVAVVGIGFGGVFGNPVAHSVDHLLDGVLASLRTVYKFAPAVSLALALGLAHGLAVVRRSVDGRRPELGRVLPVVAVAIVVLGALPIVSDGLLNSQPFSKIPSWWTQTEAYLRRVPGRTLLVPGLPFSDSTWGFTSEEPLQWGSSEWATRSIVPLGSTGATQYLDEIETVIERGGDPGLTAFLSRGGFSTVTVRNDGLWRKEDAPSPEVVNSALVASGLKLVASFGPPLARDPADPTTQPTLSQIMIYAVGTASAIQSYPLDEAALVSGDPGTPLALEQLGLGGRALVLAKDYEAGQPLPPNWIDTDGNQRTVVQFGLNRDNRSYVLTPNDAAPNNQPVDQPVAQGLSPGSVAQDQVAVVHTTVAKAGYPGDKVADQTVAVREGILRVSASSSGSWLLSTPEVSPGRALDGDPATAWVSGPSSNSSAGQWLQVELSNAVDLSSLQIRLLEDGPWRPAVHSMRVITANGTRVTKVSPDQSLQTLAVAPGRTGWIRVSFDSVTNQQKASAGAGIRELDIPGVKVQQWLKLPDQFAGHFADPATAPPSFVFQRLRTGNHSLLRSDEETTMSRQFTNPRPSTLDVVAYASAQPGSALLDLLDTTPTFVVSASSTLGGLPLYAPRNLVDGDPDTIWVASGAGSPQAQEEAGEGSGVPLPPSTDDTNPTVTMAWHGVRSLDSLQVTDAPGYTRPISVRLTAGGETRDATIKDGVATFAPISADHVTISFPEVAKVGAKDPLGNPITRPLGVAELNFPELGDLEPGLVDRSQPVTISCAEGPVVQVAGQQISFSVKTTIGGLTSLQPLAVTPCGASKVALPSGQNRLETTMGTSPFDLDTLGLVDPALLDSPLQEPRDVSVESWNENTRVVSIDPGPAAYLVVNENFSTGWKATLGGKTLQSMKIDGWRQGFVVPSGIGGVVTLEFTPARPYQIGLIVGFVLVALLIGLALVPGRLGRRDPDPIRAGTWPAWLLIAVTVVAAIAVGGITAVLLVPFWFVWRNRRAWAPLLATGCFALAGLFVALTQGYRRTVWEGAFSYPANLLALAAFMIVASTLLPSHLRREREPSDTSDPVDGDHGHAPAGPTPATGAGPVGGLH